MKNLNTGQFYGQINEIIRLDGITVTDTEYTHDKVDWHYHENAYFTFILAGSLIEGNKKETYHCSAGGLLFHNWQEAHYNIKPPGFTRGFHIELNQTWFDSLDINLKSVQGSINLLHPNLKILMYQVFKESKMNDSTRSIALPALLIDIFTRMARVQETSGRKIPFWVHQLRDVLHDTPAENWNLQALAQVLEIHPVHLSRDFTKYFNCNLGDYIRAIKVQRSLSLLPDKNRSLTDIAFECGFADQSHFIRCFKAVNSIKPSHYRNLLIK